MAGYTLGGADMLRRAMGKKKPEEMAKQRHLFIEGSSSQGIEEKLAGNIFDLVEKFAGYGFNKSHSAAYALVSYQTAWLKTYYPAPFMAAVMSSDMQNTDKVVIFIEECRQMKLKVLLPDVNLSEFKFTVGPNQEVVYGLGAVKGVGEGPVEAIIEARKEGGFKDLFDFCKRVGSKKLNKRVLESLVRSGAVDSLGPNRAVLWASIPAALQSADQDARNQDAGMFDLFGESEEVVDADPFEQFMNAREWSDKERLNGEKDTLGLYVTGHPIDEYEPELKHFVSRKLQELQPARGRAQKMAGLVVDLRVKKTKRGENLCFVTLDDRSARIDVSLFGETYDEARRLIQKDQVIVVEGEVAQDDYNGGLKVRGQLVLSVADARIRYAKSLTIKAEARALNPRSLRVLQESLKKARAYQQGMPVVIDYSCAEAKGRVELGSEWIVSPDDDLMQSLREQFGNQSVSLIY
jgi:DNA polymerase-3 subunit alpha